MLKTEGMLLQKSDIARKFVGVGLDSEAVRGLRMMANKLEPCKHLRCIF